jgi:DNA-binding GntR family transcriptional regulator
LTGPSYSCRVAQQPGRSPAKYRRIAADLLTRIEAGEYPVGSTLPTKPELIEHYSAALGTIDHALAELRNLGVAETRQGVGTFVIRQHPQPAEQANGTLQAQVERVELNLMDLYAKLGHEYPREGTTAEAEPRTVRRVRRA